MCTKFSKRRTTLRPSIRKRNIFNWPWYIILTVKLHQRSERSENDITTSLPVCWRYIRYELTKNREMFRTRSYTDKQWNQPTTNVPNSDEESESTQKYKLLHLPRKHPRHHHLGHTPVSGFIVLQCPPRLSNSNTALQQQTIPTRNPHKQRQPIRIFQRKHLRRSRLGSMLTCLYWQLLD
jgi:hypothetical protein